MVTSLADVETQYLRDKNLKKQDVKALMEWADKQSHLPKINELQAILFLHSCYYSNEAAKITIDNFFTFRTHVTEFTRGQSVKNRDFWQHADTSFEGFLPKLTPEGNGVLYMRFLDSNPDSFNFVNEIKFVEMVVMLQIHQQDITNGVVAILDFKNVRFGHVAKIGLIALKKVCYYIQAALPIRLKEIHFCNTVPFIDKIMALIRLFLKKELMEMIHLHQNVEEMTKFVPLECLPEDLGGSQEPISVLHEKVKESFEKNMDFFEWLESFSVDESKRTEKSKEIEDVFGLQGTFKKLDLD